jgi:hypothetical protein
MSLANDRRVRQVLDSLVADYPAEYQRIRATTRTSAAARHALRRRYPGKYRRRLARLTPERPSARYGLMQRRWVGGRGTIWYDCPCGETYPAADGVAARHVQDCTQAQIPQRHRLAYTTPRDRYGRFRLERPPPRLEILTDDERQQLGVLLSA